MESKEDVVSLANTLTESVIIDTANDKYSDEGFDLNEFNNELDQ